MTTSDIIKEMEHIKSEVFKLASKVERQVNGDFYSSQVRHSELLYKLRIMIEVLREI